MQSEMKHTPGPWRLDDKSMTSSGLRILGPDPKWDHALAIVKPAPATDLVANVGEHNARLIALCPEMFEYIEGWAQNGCNIAQALVDRALASVSA